MKKPLLYILAFTFSLSAIAQKNDSLIKKANSYYLEKNYELASRSFESIYRQSPTDTIYLYYAAVSATTHSDYKRSLPLYIELRDINYRGESIEYIAKNKATKAWDLFLDENTREIALRNKTHRKARQRVAKSKATEINKNIVLMQVKKNNYKDALSSIKMAKHLNAYHSDLDVVEANIHYQSGDKKTFTKRIKKLLKKDKKNVDYLYNLGVVAFENNDFKEAMYYYKKVLKENKNHINTLNNISVIVLSQENEIINEMNGLGATSKDNKRYDELKEKRIKLYESAVPYLERIIKISPNNIEILKTLLEIHKALDNSKRVNDIKSRIENLIKG